MENTKSAAALMVKTAMAAVLFLSGQIGCSSSASDPADGTSAGGQGGTRNVSTNGGTTGNGGGGGGSGSGGSNGRTDAGSFGGAGSPGDAAGGASGGGDARGPDGAGGTATPVGASPILGDVTFSTPSQSFRDRLMVGMTAAAPNAEIRYTTDGKPPTATSTLYDGTPLALTATTQLRAQAFTAGVASGRMSTAIYIARTFDLTSSLPIVLVDGYGKGKPSDKDVSLDAAVMIFEPAGGMAALTNLPTLVARAGYHVRGQSSANFPQTPYKIELWDNANADVDQSVIGMPAQSDWALIPPYYDRALMRNPFVYSLGRDLGMEVPRVKNAEVYINYAARAMSAQDYQGIYWISETIKNASTRTNLTQLRETDIALPKLTGGYIFKFDQAAAEAPILTCTGSPPLRGGLGMTGGGGTAGTCWRDLEVIDPSPLAAEQQTWITQYIQQFHNVLHATPLGDYAAFMDVRSFVDNLIINELTRNVDAYVRSSYYHKDRDGKLKAGPLWDYNFSLGVGGTGTTDPNGPWQFAGTRNVNNWYPKLTADAAFMEQVKTRFRELRATVLSAASINQRIDGLAAALATDAVTRDYAKWPVATVYRNTGFVRGPSTVTTWEGQVQAMRDFVLARLTWMETQLR